MGPCLIIAYSAGTRHTQHTALGLNCSRRPWALNGLEMSRPASASDLA